MNERIKKLAEQTGFGPAWFEQAPTGHPTLPKEGMLKEFAELIVRECANIANKQFSAASGLTDRDSWTAAEIKKHFGVEE